MAIVAFVLFGYSFYYKKFIANGERIKTPIAFFGQWETDCQEPFGAHKGPFRFFGTLEKPTTWESSYVL